MSTSLWEAYVETYNPTDNDQLDALQARIAINNANHLADSIGQVRAAWASVGGGETRTLTQGTDDDAWYLYDRGLITLFKRHDGLPFKLRGRVAGRVTGSGPTATFRLRVGSERISKPRGHLADEFDDLQTSPPPPWVLEFSTTSTTVSWMSPGSDLIMDLTASQFRESIVEQETLTSFGGDPATVQMPLMFYEVWAKSTNVANGSPELNGVYIAEFYGS